MTGPGAAEYLRLQVLRHTRLCFEDRANDVLHATDLQFIPYAEAIDARRPGIFIPTDIQVPLTPELLRHVPFNGTVLTLSNPLSRPGVDWVAWPDERNLLWWRHQQGALIPAWNIFANLFSALTLREDRELPARDLHGRFAAESSPRLRPNLLAVPVFNEAAAALVGAAVGLSKNGEPSCELNDLVKPPILVLSHDCDLLRGNDVLTQAIRIYRMVRPIADFRFPATRHLAYAVWNTIAPERHFLRSVYGMLDLESQYGYLSTWYILNGSSGRYGMRSGTKTTRKFVRTMRGRPLGMHYNYDTFLDSSNFARQKRELEEWSGESIAHGRAHYLRFDPELSAPFLEDQGIRFDESVGWPNKSGFRAGIAGAYDMWDSRRGRILDLVQCPLVFMDSNLPASNIEDCFGKVFAHLRRIGGVITILWHTDKFNNPEVPLLRGAYQIVLQTCYAAGCPALLPDQLIKARLAAGA